MISLQTTVHTLTVWINSCKTYEQLTQIEARVEPYLCRHYATAACVLQAYQSNLQHRIESRRLALSDAETQPLKIEHDLLEMAYGYAVTPGGDLVRTKTLWP